MAATLALLVIAVIAVCEFLGWPFLAKPLESALAGALDRRVSFHERQDAPPKAVIHLLGGIRLQADYIEVGAPSWSQEPHMLVVRDGRVRLGYFDLLRASLGSPLRVKELSAASLDGRLERLADGRASWQFGKSTDAPDTNERPTALPEFVRLEIASGTATYRDAVEQADLQATFSLVDGAQRVAMSNESSSASAAGSAASQAAAGSPVASGTTSGQGGFQLSAKGTYQKFPVTIGLSTPGVLQVLGEDASAVRLPVSLDASLGGAKLTFRGTATDALNLTALRGRFSVAGPSLSAVGDPLKVTLPTTGAFATSGLIAKDGLVWNAVFDSATVGTSRLAGAFQYDPRPKVPTLSGRLTGSRLLLQDLGPAVGTSAPSASAAVASNAAAPGKDATTTKSKSGKTTGTPTAGSNEKRGKVLPDREFDLPALRAMNANVLVDIDNLDLGSSILEPLKPLRMHIVLANGVLSLNDIDARTGKGRVYGMLQLDGRSTKALWSTNLRWDQIRLEDWIRQERSGGESPYIAGALAGQARLAGQGNSTAAILGTLGGGVRMQLSNGSVSHLAIEAAGLDIAQGIGMLVKGDDSLPLLCTVADFSAEQGVLKPRAFLIDTEDSVLWVNGAVSLKNEQLDLKVTTTPKDFSPLAIRTPVTLGGTFSDPKVGIEVGKLAPRVGVAALLALVNPLAALLPFIDTGDKENAQKGANACKELSSRIAAHSALPAPVQQKAPARPAKSV